MKTLIKLLLIGFVLFLFITKCHAQKKVDSTAVNFTQRVTDKFGTIFYGPDGHNFCFKYKDGTWSNNFKDSLSAMNAIFSSDSALSVYNIGLHLRINVLAEFAARILEFNNLPDKTSPEEVNERRIEIKKLFEQYKKLKELYP